MNNGPEITYRATLDLRFFGTRFIGQRMREELEVLLDQHSLNPWSVIKWAKASKAACFASLG
jgi:hypothetical protein